MGTNRDVKKDSGWYTAGEYTETGISVVSSAGSGLLKGATKRAVKNEAIEKLGKEGFEKLGDKGKKEALDSARKRLEARVRKDAREKVQAARERQGLDRLTRTQPVHHQHPLVGHPGVPGYQGGRRTWFETLGTPDYVRNSRFNLKAMEGGSAAHKAAHSRLIRAERVIEVIHSPAAVGARGVRLSTGVDAAAGF